MSDISQEKNALFLCMAKWGYLAGEVANFLLAAKLFQSKNISFFFDK